VAHQASGRSSNQQLTLLGKIMETWYFLGSGLKRIRLRRENIMYHQNKKKKTVFRGEKV